MLFESWLMAYNVAYAFERTPFYRPWLSWVGVDLRRLGVEDLVSICSQILDRVVALSRIMKRATAAATADKAKPLEKGGGLTGVLRHLLLTSPRLAQVPSSNCHIFHQIPRVVVLSVLSRTRPFEVAPWARHPTASLTPTASERDKNRQNTIRMLSVVRLYDRECDRASFWIRVLLQVCV